MGAPEELIAGRYRLSRRIAAGGMGVVWEARDELLQRPVAVKQLRTQVGVPDDEAEFAKQRAMREARITARLHHPNAVVVFDSVEHEGEPCLVMQYVPSTTLSAMLKEHGALPTGEVARIGAQIAAALAAAHDLGIVHRDVKPGNILIADSDGTAMLSDFGISHALGDATLTSTGLVHGTPAYLAPEVARGEESTYASDVFSLGSTLYAASEGEAPFGEAPNSIAVLHRVAVGGFAAPQRSGALGPLLLQMMADEPGARPAMRDVALQLAALQAEEDGTEAPTLPLVSAAETETGALEITADTLLVPTAALPAPAAPATGAAADGPDARTSTAPVPAEEDDALEEGATTRTAPAPELADAEHGPVGTGGTLEERSATRTAPTPLPAPPLAAATAPDAPVAPPADPGPPTGGDGGGGGRRRRTALLATLAAVVLLGAALGLVRLLQPTDDGAGAAPTRSATVAPASASPSATASPSPASPSATATATPTSTPTPTATATPTRTPTPAPTTTTGAGTGTSLTAANMVAAISGYYRLVPGNTGAAWSRLTGAYQTDHAGGRAAFDRFWNPVASVGTSGVRATGADTVRATITYRYKDGKVTVEDTSYRLVAEGGVLKIADSTVISSTG